MPAAGTEALEEEERPPSLAEVEDANQFSVNSEASSGGGSVRGGNGQRSQRGPLAPIPSVGANGLGGEFFIMRKQKSMALTPEEAAAFERDVWDEEAAVFARRRGSRTRRVGGRSSFIPPANACVYPVAMFIARLKRLFRVRRRRGASSAPEEGEGGPKGKGIGELGQGEGLARTRRERQRRLSETVGLGLSQSGASAVGAGEGKGLGPQQQGGAERGEALPAYMLTYPAALWQQQSQQQRSPSAGTHSSSTLPLPVSASARPRSRGGSSSDASSSSFIFRPFSGGNGGNGNAASGREEAKSSNGISGNGSSSSSSSNSSGGGGNGPKAAAAATASSGSGGGSSPDRRAAFKKALWEAESDPGSDDEGKVATAGEEGGGGRLPRVKIQRQISV